MNLSPYIIHTEFISLRWYGFLIGLAVLISYYLALREIKKEKIDEGKFDSIFLITVLSGIIGARLGFVMQGTSFFFSNPKEIFAFWDGGLSIHGAIILGSTALIITSKIYKINFFRLANIISPYLLLSGAIGRWGNYFNREIIGKPTEGFLKMFIPEQSRPSGYLQFSHFHPVFLYESILLFSAFILFIIFKNKLKKYAIAYTLVTYSLIRIIVEFWRIDYKPICWHLDLAQLVSFGIIIVTVGVALVQKTLKSH
jgi:phosphatidylglycerol:prolipoprotein diacylglycerol transferase